MRQISRSIALSDLLPKHHRSLVIQHKQECFISNRRWGLHHICVDEQSGKHRYSSFSSYFVLLTFFVNFLLCVCCQGFFFFFSFFKPVRKETIPPCGVTFSRRHNNAGYTLSRPLHKQRRAAALQPQPLSLPVDVLTTKDSSQVRLKVASVLISCSFRQTLFANV